jgi:hypothetical protein
MATAASGAQATIPQPTITRVAATKANKRLVLWIILAAVAVLGISGLLFYFNRPHTNKDDFSADKALDPRRWQASTPLLTTLAEAQGSRYVAPLLTFDQSGMRMAGVNGTYEFTGVQSTYSLSPPFTIRVKVMGTISHGNTFALYLLGNDLRQSLAIEGNLNPQSGYQGLSIGSVKVLRDVGTNQWYTVVIAVDAKGSATVTFSDSRDTILATKAGLQVGLGPFFVVLGQREGAPFTVGPNEAVWSFAEVTSSSNLVASNSNENTVSDADIVRNIKAAFFNDATLRKDTIDVTAQNGIVTLIGVVNTDSDKSNAVRIANQQQGVRQVVDQLVLSGESSSSETSSLNTGPKNSERSPTNAPPPNVKPDTREFVVGRGPWGVAFDGANVWVTNGHDGTVTKLRASDGTNLGTFRVGSEPYGVAFDGTNVWVANYGGGGGTTVTKLRADDGMNLGTFAVGNGPNGIAFDGTNIWVTNYGPAASGSTVTKLRSSDGMSLGTFTVGKGPHTVAFDGANIWITNSSSNSVTKLRASDGATLGTFLVGKWPAGVAFDGANVWVANQHGDNVTVLSATVGSNLGTFGVGSAPYAVAFDGANVWVTNSGGNTVSKLRIRR